MISKTDLGGESAGPRALDYHTFYLSLIVGSPNSSHVRRTSGSPTPDLALPVASPSVDDPFALSRINLKICRFKTACSVGAVIPDDAHTATAPPSLFMSDSARLSSDASWK